jgi:hypothetical protein
MKPIKRRNTFKAIPDNNIVLVTEKVADINSHIPMIQCSRLKLYNRSTSHNNMAKEVFQQCHTDTSIT